MKIKRFATDSLVFSKKGRGKTLYMTWYAFLMALEGKTVFSNYHLNFDHVRLHSLDDLRSISSGIALFDDCERWFSSKFLSNKDKADALEVTLNLGKRNTHVFFSSKRPEEVDKTIRMCLDYYIETSFELAVDVDDEADFDVKAEDMENCCLRVDVYDESGSFVKTEYLYDLDIYAQLYDTTEEVTKLGR